MIEEPTAYTAHQLKNQLPNWSNSTEFKVDDKQEIWIPARSLTMQRFILIKRLKLALDVFLGRADVLYWDRLRPDDKKET